MSNQHPAFFYTADIGALFAILGWFAGMLPAIAALLAIVWYGIQIWESNTVRKMFGRDKSQ